MRRRHPLAFLWAAVTAAVSGWAPDSGQAAPRNIVVVVADDLSPAGACYGADAIRLPALDALAADGVLFSHASATTASCSASRSVLLTGLHNHANGHYGHQHHFHKFSSYPWIESLPVLLSRHGYRTARVGKLHVAPEEVYRFDAAFPANARNPVQMAEACREFLSADDPRPFFLYYATADPHRGGGQANELPHRPDRFGNLPERRAYPGVEETFYQPEDVPVPAFLPDTPTARAELAQYAQAASRVDQGLRRLVQILRDTGACEDTLIVFTADHGMAFPGAKTTVYEGGLRIPLVVRNPYQPVRGLTNRALVSLADLTPTLLDFAGALPASRRSAGLHCLEWPGTRHYGAEGPFPGYPFHGRSFLPVLHRQDPPGWDAVFASHTFHEIQMYYPMRAYRDRNYKLIWNLAHPLPFPFASDLWAAPTWQEQYRQGPEAPYGFRSVGGYIQRPAFELFDLEKDPDERANLAADPAHRETLQRMQGLLKQAQAATGDPWISKWDYE